MQYVSQASKVLFLILVVTLLIEPSGHQYTVDHRFPKCSRCTSIVGSSGAKIRIVLDTFDALSYDACSMDLSKEKQCLATKDDVLNVLNSLTDELFPRSSETTSRTLSCSKLLGLCPDTNKDGIELSPQEWSCTSCVALLNTTMNVMKLFSPEKLCNESTTCLEKVKTVFRVEGQLTDVLQGKGNLEEICSKVLDCVP